MIINRKISFVISFFLLLLLVTLATSTNSSINSNNNDRNMINDNDNNNEIVLESFTHPEHIWKEMNDPVMGGQSVGTFRINTEHGIGIFQGEVKNVSFLHAPGFIQVRTIDFNSSYPDISDCHAILLVLRSHTYYTGYRFSFGNKHAKNGKMFAFGYKATLGPNVPLGPEFGTMIIPIQNFTNNWDDATGDPIITCYDNHEYCPDNSTLHNIRTMAIWGEGVEGIVSLEIQSIKAIGCTTSSKSSSTTNRDMQQQPLQEKQHPTLLRASYTNENNNNNNNNNNGGVNVQDSTNSYNNKNNNKNNNNKHVVEKFIRGWAHQFAVATNLFDSIVAIKSTFDRKYKRKNV